MTEDKKSHRKGVTDDALIAWAIDQFAQRRGKRLTLKTEQWEAFMAALNAPPRRNDRLDRLLTEPSLLD